MVIELDFHTPGLPIRHPWRVCVGGGRVAEAMRADFQKHLEMAQREMPFDYIRMHGLFHEDMMVYREEAGTPIYNFQYVDLVYDHWLSIGIRPFVELGFMPYDLASGPETIFWWKGNITPPRDWQRWEDLVRAFVLHTIERYGLAEVQTWYFEVWNEPNLPFFWKDADFEAYLELYERTTRVIKAIDRGLRVGGPASSGPKTTGVAPWGEAFLSACKARGLPIDFFSTHPYPTDLPLDTSGKMYMVWDGPERLVTDLLGFHTMLEATGCAHLETHYTEWNSSPVPRDPSHDAAFMAPFIVQNNWMARNLADSLSYWVISDIFEESRVGDTPFHGGFGLVTVQGLKKPAYHGYWFLAHLGEEELASGDGYAVTRHADGHLTMLFWNYCHYTRKGNDSRRVRQAARDHELYTVWEHRPAVSFDLDVSGLRGTVRLQTTRFDRRHGSVYDAWMDMGAPAHLRPQDLAVLRSRMEPAVTVERTTTDGTLARQIVVEPHGVTMVELTLE